MIEAWWRKRRKRRRNEVEGRYEEDVAEGLSEL